MRKQRIEYHSIIDALITLAKRLSLFEEKYKMISEEFFDKFSKGSLDDSAEFIEWSNDYQNYVALKLKIEKLLRQVA